MLVVDKTGVAAGASGIACGVVRNNYFQPAMPELMAACVEIWESDPQTLAYHGSGYVALGDGAQEADLATVFERQQRIGYESELDHGRAPRWPTHMRALFPDWRAPGLSVCLHEKRGRLRLQPRLDARPGLEGARGGGDDRGGRGGHRLRARRLGCGDPRATRAPGRSRPSRWWWPSARGSPDLWEMLGLPAPARGRAPDGSVAEEQEMWTYWYLQEGEIDVDPSDVRHRRRLAAAGDARGLDAPLHDDEGRLVADEQWGIYFKQDKHACRAAPRRCRRGTSSRWTPIPPARAEPGFPDLWCAALSHCMSRFEGKRPQYRQVRSGGVGAFTADNFPVFD